MTEAITDTDTFTPDVGVVHKLNKDLRNAAKTLTSDEARYLVDLYYATQEKRIRAAAQMREASKAGEPNELLKWAFSNFETTEKGIKSALFQYSKSTTVGAWMLSIHGIGPVLSAGMLAHLSIEPWKCAKASKKVAACRAGNPHDEDCHSFICETAGSFWRFAGLDPTAKWEKKTKRPWNANLKVLCWKVGQSFMKLRSFDNDIYGKVYEERKVYEIARNDRGGNAESAQVQLNLKRFGQNKTREILESGKLPPGQIDARARRYAVKLFLSHLHHVMYEDRFKTAPPKPYIIAVGEHTHFIAPPLWPVS